MPTNQFMREDEFNLGVFVSAEFSNEKPLKKTVKKGNWFGSGVKNVENVRI